jgi:hypothetical protein
MSTESVRFGWFPTVGCDYRVTRRFYGVAGENVRVDSIDHKRKRVCVSLIAGVVGAGARVVLTFDECEGLMWEELSRPNPFA